MRSTLQQKLKICVWFLELKIIGDILVYIQIKNNLIHKFVSFAKIKEPPLFAPNHAWEDPKDQHIISVNPDLSAVERIREATKCLLDPSIEKKYLNCSYIFHRWTIMDFSRAYNSGETSPLMVAKKFVSSLQDSSKPHLQMSFFIEYNIEDILEQARESTHRYQNGRPISVLDGVLIAVKDEIDCLPYSTTGGTKWLQRFRTCKKDAACIKNLRLCGAILVGKTNMHELGIGTSGINPHYGVTRNPYDPEKIAGGSSSGSAAVVSAGLCPVALGVDGGGSVRIPASLCGVVGLKPTNGRFSHDGIIPLNWTVGNVGVLAGTVEDAFIVYAALSDHLLSSCSTKVQWFNHCADDIQICCDKALSILCKKHGWKTLDVTIPEIEEMRIAHYLTIGTELATSFSPHLENLNFKEIGCDTRIALCMYRSFSGRDYLNAQKIRNRQMYFHKKIFKTAEIIVAPTIGVTAYPIKDGVFKTGELDYKNGEALVRFSIAGNFLGLPAITVMVGYDRSGLPVGLQFIGKPWSEATLLHLAYAMQELCINDYKKPKIFFDVLKKD